MKNDETLTIKALFIQLKQVWKTNQLKVNHKWKRTLPFGDYIVDRWEKAKILNFGQGTSIYDSSLVIGDVVIGSNTWIGPFTVLDGSGGLKIGDYCSISAGVQIYSHSSVDWALSGGNTKYQRQSTQVGSRCYIGPNSIIEMGVTIGDGCLIGANSLINRSVPEHSMACGSPCEIRPLNP